VAARAVVASEDLVEAAGATALLASRCASCHAAISAKVVFPKEAAPKDDPRLPTQMASHRWAVARMREGVVGPSNERWLEGARTLAKAPLTLTAESDELGIADDVARVRLLARRALTTKPGERGALYGELLGTCARCHHTIRDVRPPAKGR
jgi:hypothetical protein